MTRELTKHDCAASGEIEANKTKGKCLRAVIDVCPDDIVISIARTFDEERKEGQTRGHLHGIPLIVK